MKNGSAVEVDKNKKMTKNFEQISLKPGFMKHNGGVMFRNISETEYEFHVPWTKIIIDYFSAWKHTERNTHRNRKRYLL